MVDPVNNYLVQRLAVFGEQWSSGGTGRNDAGGFELGAGAGSLLTPRMVTPGMTIGQALQDAKSDTGADASRDAGCTAGLVADGRPGHGDRTLIELPIFLSRSLASSERII